MTNQGLGIRLKSTREAQGLKRIQLAVAADVTSNTIRNYEEGLTGASLEPLIRIAKALDVDLMWLVEGDKEAVA